MTIDAPLTVTQTSTANTAAPLTPLLLITADPSHPLAALALRYAQAYLASPVNEPNLQVFFYADAAQTANRLRWQSADQLDITKAWQQLTQDHQLRLAVCVSTALSRGISDVDNSQRHQLQGDNIAEGFELVGLGELAMMLQTDCRVLQF